MAFQQDVILLHEFQTNTILELESRGAGTYTKKMRSEGNSLLSSIFIRSIDPGATLQVNYFDTTTGEQFSERYDLNNHDLITDSVVAPFTDRITVTKIHNKPVVEAIVTGGNVDFGIYVSVVSSFASDLDDALIRDGDTWVPDDSRAIPIACLDEDLGTLNFLRCKEGSLSVSEVGDPFNLNAEDVSINPGSFVTVLSRTVPAGTEMRITQAGVSCSVSGVFQVLAGGSIIGVGRTAPGKPDAVRKFDPKRPIAPGTEVIVRFRARVGAPNSGGSPTTVDGFMDALDVTV